MQQLPNLLFYERKAFHQNNAGEKIKQINHGNTVLYFIYLTLYFIWSLVELPPIKSGHWHWWYMEQDTYS